MQINRLFEIVYILLERGRVTARELAERFEVSTRTIYRDVEILSGAGIPIYMVKGQGGGIRLLGEFVLNKALLSSEEQGDILSSLQGMRALDALSEEDTLEKLQRLFGRRESSWIDIDFGDWGNLIRAQFETIRSAILQRLVIEFDYISAGGVRSRRRVEPMQLWFKDHTWYLRSYCLERRAPRLFRLSRMRGVRCTDQQFAMRVIEREPEQEWSDGRQTVIRMCVAASQEYRIYDEFREEDVRQKEDGSFEVTMRFIVDDWVYGYILSFGEAAEVLEPEDVRREVCRRLARSLEKYSK